MKNPTSATIHVGHASFEQKLSGRSGDQFAWEVLSSGYRHFDPETKIATFYPPHRIECVILEFGDD